MHVGLDRVILARSQRVAASVSTRRSLVELDARGRRVSSLLRSTLVLQLVLLIANGLFE